MEQKVKEEMEAKEKEEEKKKKMLKELPKTLSSNADSVIDELMNEEDGKR